MVIQSRDWRSHFSLLHDTKVNISTGFSYNRSSIFLQVLLIIITWQSTFSVMWQSGLSSSWKLIEELNLRVSMLLDGRNNDVENIKNLHNCISLENLGNWNFRAYFFTVFAVSRISQDPRTLRYSSGRWKAYH